MIVNARYSAHCADCGAEADVPCAQPCLSRLATPAPGVPRPRATSTPESRFPTTASEWLGEREGLSAHEGAIVSLIVLGLSNQEIAGALHKSLQSIRTHIRSAYRKMGVTNRPQAIAWGNLHGYNLIAPAARADESGPK